MLLSPGVVRFHGGNLSLRIPNRRLAHVRREKGCCKVGDISHDSSARPRLPSPPFSGGGPLSRSVAGVRMGMFRLSPGTTCPSFVLPSLLSAIQLRYRHKVLENNRIEHGNISNRYREKGKVEISSTGSAGGGSTAPRASRNGSYPRSFLSYGFRAKMRSRQAAPGPAISSVSNAPK